MMWSDEEPPWEGPRLEWWYVRSKAEGRFDDFGRVAFRDDPGVWRIGNGYYHSECLEFGPRIPTPEEMENDRRAMNESLNLIIELRRELAELRKGGG